MCAGKMKRSLLALVPIFVIGLGLRLGFVWNGTLDPDESQHLHAAWLVAHGRILYVDFWEHHGPLFYYLVAPLTRLFTDSPGVYFATRGLMLLAAAAALGLLYLVLRRLEPPVAPLAIALLCLQPGLIEYTTQIRPDVPALCTWVAALLALIRWRETGASRWIWSTGLLLGATAAFSPKAIYELTGVSVLVLAAGWVSRTSARRTLTAFARLAVGSAVPLLLILGWMWATGGPGAPEAFFRSVVIDNLAFPDASRRTLFAVQNAIVVLLAGVGTLIVVRRLRLGVVTHPVHGPLLVPALVISILLLLPTTPAVYEYTWLPVAVVAAAYAAVGTAAFIRISPRRPVVTVLIVVIAVGAFIHPAAVAAIYAVRNENAAKLRDMERELTYACPDDAVFDATGLYVFRAAASRYAALVVGIRREIGLGQIPVTDVIDQLRSSRAPVGLWDRRLQIIGGPIADFARRYYVRQPDGLLLAGATIAPTPAGAPGRASVELLRHTLYRVSLPVGSTVQIDGTTVLPGLLPLTAGRHVVTWSALPGPIRITASTCAERLAGGEAERW